MLSKVFSQIQNGFLTKKTIIILRINSKFLINFLNILIKEGYIYGYKILQNKNIMLYLKYINHKPSLIKIQKIQNLKYINIKKLQSKKNSLFLYILSTSKGLLSHKEALKKNQGGQILCKIY